MQTWVSILILMISFGVILYSLSTVDWGIFLRVEKREKWNAIALWLIISFALAVVVTIGFLIISGGHVIT